MDFHRGTFRVHGDVLDIFPANADDTAIRVEFFGVEIDRIVEVDVLTGEVKCSLEHTMIFPASHYVVSQEKINEACLNIEKELDERVKYFKGEDKLIEAQRIAERTNFDIEMMRETGFCSGIENYTRHLNFAKPGEPPMTLIDFFPDDFLIIVDESHITIPQIGGMYAGDRSRKTTLVDTRSSICPSTGRTDISGSKRPVGLIICSARSSSCSFSYLFGVAETKSIWSILPSNSSKLRGPILT